ncbi:hypothetical protein [Streptomyces althioticus]|uniref:hypothetical protein n=1 Tax=Streptomyces althioticus TaxID=83380 RepID=UPI00380A7275
MARGTVRGHRVVGAGLLLLLASAGCGSPAGDSGDGGATAAPPVRDKGPVCVGEAPADGVRVLRGGGFRLPGGTGVQYAGASADGSSRTATLREGPRYEDGQREWKVAVGARVPLAGHAYTVRQVCSYRVVLEAASARDASALAEAPASMTSTGGEADAGLCFTTNRAVLKAAADGFPAEGESLSLVGNGGVRRFPTGLSLTVSYLDAEAGTAGIAANCAAVPVAAYEELRVGDPLELGGVLFEVTDVTEAVVRLTRPAAPRP